MVSRARSRVRVSRVQEGLARAASDTRAASREPSPSLPSALDITLRLRVSRWKTTRRPSSTRVWSCRRGLLTVTPSTCCSSDPAPTLTSRRRFLVHSGRVEGESRMESR